MNKKHWMRRNTFFGRIIAMVLTGIVLIAVTVSAVVLVMSERAFTETYGKSQEQVFRQIENELDDFHTSLQTVINAIDTSWAFRLYLDGDSQLNNEQNFQNIYQMEKDLNESKTSDMDRMNILVVGMNGKHYLSRTETISMDDERIMQSQAMKRAIAEPESMHYTFSRGAYTATTINSNVIIASKALYYRESKEVYAVVFVTLSMDDMLQYYDYFVSEYTDWYLVGDSGLVFCSSDTSKVGNVMKESWYQKNRSNTASRYTTKIDGRGLTILQQRMSYYGCTMYGVIDNGKALGELYDMPLLIVMCVCIGSAILAVCLWFARRTLQPLSQLVERMAQSRKENFRQYVEVTGTMEVRELASTYNDMLDDIQSYVEELLETQQAQRKSEIKALQMQINPHYIYNTLASIKWLVYQNDVEKTTKTIDAFISLLRNTISNMDEFITIEQEMTNLQNYILINHTRYGDAIGVEYYVSHNCYDCLLPKLILQPFIENAFFHAFPSGQDGTIQIFMKEVSGDLEIQIVDDGIGMDETQARDAIVRKKEHFSGIGIHNVHDRLQLLYGTNYGIEIHSIPKRGTMVRIRLPIRRQQEENGGLDEQVKK